MKSKGYSPTHLNRGSNKNEKIITCKIKKIISSKKGKKRIEKMKELQLRFFADAIYRIYVNKDRTKNYADYLNLIESLIGVTDFYYDFSCFNSDDFSTGVIIITGHFGIAKATKISKFELLLSLKEKKIEPSWLKFINTPPNNEPFPLRKAAILKTIFEIFGRDNITTHEIHMWYPFPFDEIQRDCNVVGINLDNATLNYTLIKIQLDRLFSLDIKEKKLPVVIFTPEPSTMGKKTKSFNPYELGEFQTGFAAYARDESLPIIPIIQVVDKEASFRTKVLPTIRLNKGYEKNQLTKFVVLVKDYMQRELNNLLQEV